MIAELGITILLLCNSPVYVVAEIGGETRAYRIERYEYENGRLKYYLGDQADRFIGTVQRRMIARNQQPKMVNRMLCET